MLRCEGTRTWKDQILIKGFMNINAEISIRRTVGCKNKSSGRK
jgi:hypothetical protein